MKLQQETYGFELTEYLACFSCWAKYLSRERFLIIFVGFFSTVWFRSGSWEGVNWLIYKAEVVSIFVVCSIMDLFLNLFYWKFLQCFPNLYRNPILHQMPSFNFATPVFPMIFPYCARKENTVKIWLVTREILDHRGANSIHGRWSYYLGPLILSLRY